MATEHQETGTIEQLPASQHGVRFLGVGGKGSSLGPTAVVERGSLPLLQIDCPPGALDAHRDQYGAPPRNLYITHTHLDHIGGMEELFHGIIADVEDRPEGRVRVFAHAQIVPSLQKHGYDRFEVGRVRNLSAEIGSDIPSR